MGTTQEGKVKHTMICSFSSFFFLLFFQPNSFNEHTQLISASCFPLLILCFLCVSILSSILKRQIYFHFHSFDATILFFISVYSYIDDLLLHPCVCVCVFISRHKTSVVTQEQTVGSKLPWLRWPLPPPTSPLPPLLGLLLRGSPVWVWRSPAVTAEAAVFQVQLHRRNMWRLHDNLTRTTARWVGRERKCGISYENISNPYLLVQRDFQWETELLSQHAHSYWTPRHRLGSGRNHPKSETQQVCVRCKHLCANYSES